MGFNERTHAFLAARYYARLKETFGERGVAAFIHGVQYYAGQRGRRMAQRAIREGQPLTHATYLQYGELKSTELVQPTDKDVLEVSPDYVIRIRRCPWHDQFEAMGALEAGQVYCRYLDEAICRGFNPDLRFRVERNLNSADCCVHRVAETRYEAPPALPPREQYRRDFSFHCGHLFWSMREVCRGIFGPEGETVSDGVLADFRESYGQEMEETLRAWEHHDFNVCDD